MNIERRKRIASIRAKLEELKSDIETIQGEEQGYFDAMPESIQACEKGDKAQSAADALQAAADSIDDIVSSLEEAAE